MDGNEQQVWSLLAEHLRPGPGPPRPGHVVLELDRLDAEELSDRVAQQIAAGGLDDQLRRAGDRRRIDWEDVLASAAGRLASLPLEALVDRLRRWP